ncbi:MAG: DUF4234 domain-containing protein [Solirubrobacterales bacterium]
MAEQVQIPGTQAVGKVRNPLAVVALAFITLGIYFFFWYFYVNRELKEVGQAAGTEECGTSPCTSLVAVTLGAFLIIPPFISLYNAFKRLNAAHKLTVGPGEAFDAGLGILLWILISPIAMYIFQMKMNEVLVPPQAEAPVAPAAAPPTTVPQQGGPPQAPADPGA